MMRRGEAAILLAQHPVERNGTKPHAAMHQHLPPGDAVWNYSLHGHRRHERPLIEVKKLIGIEQHVAQVDQLLAVNCRR